MACIYMFLIDEFLTWKGIYYIHSTTKPVVRIHIEFLPGLHAGRIIDQLAPRPAQFEAILNLYNKKN